MKSIIYLILLVIIIASCTKQKNKIYQNKKVENLTQSGIKPQKKLNETLLPTDTTILKEGSTLLGMVFEQKIQKNKIFLKDTSHPFYSVFDVNSGQLMREFSNKHVKDIVFPKISPNGISISDDSVFILYSWVNKIFILTKDGQYLKTIKLKFPNLSKLTADKSKSFFEFDPNKKIFILSTTYPSLGNNREKFANSTIISIFDMDGGFIRTFGKYPDSYTKGGVLGDFRAIYDGEFIYILFLNGYSKIRKYNLDGKLIYEYDNTNHKFNYKLNYFSGDFDPYNAPKNDRYQGFAIDRSNGKQIFYMDYVLKTANSPKERRKRHLLKYDIIENTYSEHIIPDGLRLVYAYMGLLYMYTDNNEMHEILLIKYEIK